MRRPWLQGLLAVAGFTLGVLIIAGIGVFLHYDRQAAKFDLSQVARMPQESTVYDIQGRELGYLHGDGRTVVPLEQVAPNFQRALVAREDSRFYGHSGIDVWGLLRATMRNLKDRDAVQGASTLTMQLARNTFDLREKSFQRKLLEMAIARRIEKAYTKDEILYLYVNRIYFGTGLNGIEQAARGYFGKSAATLDLAESAMIAGIIRAPNRFSPYRHYDAALNEMRTTIDRMVDEGVLDEELAKTAKLEEPRVLSQDEGFRIAHQGRDHSRVLQESYLVEVVKQEVDRLLTEEQRDAGGFEIYTTFDLDLQKAAETAVEKRLEEIEGEPNYPHPTLSAFRSRFENHPELEPDYLQAAVSVIDNRSGAVRALVGGRDVTHSRFNRATQAHRQLGSVFKPLVYATAFETGLFPGTYVSDDPIRPGEIRWFRGQWSPDNADGQFLGSQPVSKGLIESRNTMSVRVGERAGIDAVLAMIEHAGLATKAEIQPNPQLYIGNLGATLNSLVSAYSAFPNDGYRYKSFFIERIESRDHEILFEPDQAGYRVVSPGAAWLVRSIMQETLEPGGTGASVRKLGFKAPAGGKTGTTNNYRDAWFVGYTGNFTCAVWYGNDDYSPTNRMTGGSLPAQTWHDI
ncbi:MAG: transglycosylase domain-containing protein, partial [Verrucomicrobiae bacterium]|nr:transglycosylase domain-containing protein [Verrucomicrobiae bacterium]